MQHICINKYGNDITQKQFSKWNNIQLKSFQKRYYRQVSIGITALRSYLSINRGRTATWRNPKLSKNHSSGICIPQNNGHTDVRYYRQARCGHTAPQGNPRPFCIRSGFSILLNNKRSFRKAVLPRLTRRYYRLSWQFAETFWQTRNPTNLQPNCQLYHHLGSWAYPQGVHIFKLLICMYMIGIIYIVSYCWCS